MSEELLGKEYVKACSIIDKEISIMKNTDYLFNNEDVKLRDGDNEISFKDAILKLEKDLLEKRKNKQFTISVCGMVKAGKSTFINSFLFGKHVLPAFDTPWSAKLTFVEYTDKRPYFEAIFYTEEEFEALEVGYKEQKLDKEFEQMKAKAFQKGVSKNNYIKSVPHKETRYNFEDLEEFVTDLKNEKALKAKYTPYVKEVHVYVNDKSIEKFRIVDTPGLHDTNVINSEETYKWISQTHALIFLLPPKGIIEDDFEFFKKYQSAKGPEGRIFILNRIDEAGTPEDAARVVSSLKDIGKKDKRFKDINMFGVDEEICRYSSLAQMLQSMKENHIPFDEKYEDEWYWEEQGLKNYEADPDDVKGKISERLYNNAGKIIINSSVSDISQVYFRIFKNLELHKDLFNSELKDCDKSMEELNTEIKKLEKMKSRVNERINSFKYNAEEEAESNKDILINMLNEADRELHIDVANYSFGELKGLPSLLRLKIQQILDLETGSLGRKIKRYTKIDMPRAIDNILKQVRDIYEENCIDEPVILRPLEGNVKEDWNARFEKVVGEFKFNLDEVLPWNWFTQLFTRRKTMQDNAKPYIDKAVTQVRTFVSGQIKAITDQMINYVKSNINDFIQVTENAITSKRKIVENNRKEKELRKQKLINLIQAQDNNIVDLKNKIDAFKAQCSKL